MPINYANGKIYKIINKDIPNKIYIGSTTADLVTRYNHHNYKTNPTTSKELFLIGTPEIILIENVKCNNKKELLEREKYHILNTENTVNKYIPTRTLKEYRADNREYCIRQTKIWNDKNKEYRHEKITCSCGSIISRAAYLRHLKSNKHKSVTV